MPFTENLVWIDLEMTGLDPDADRILEIATIVTDSSLNILEEGPSLAIRQSEELLAGMDEWNTEHHAATGLIDRVRSEGVSEQEAERQTLDFIKKYVGERESPLCGNSIGQDRRFLNRYMPGLIAWLHYRSVDVSTIKELALRWHPDVYHGVQKRNAHRAMDDVRESIGELRYYRDRFFRLP
ncbi:MAG: oligoribonuclease [Pseudomonadales bacterium]|nr:oligoribonuclease [Pseudomonadales bacterium]